MTKFRPLGDRVLVLPDAAPVKVGGLKVPGNQQDKATQGVVVAVGHAALCHSGVDKEGKKIVVHDIIEKTTTQQAVFYAGNSGGDLKAMEYILSKDNSLGLLVNPRGGLEKLLQKTPSRTVKLSYEEAN